MSLENCPKCGKVFIPPPGGRRLCKACIQQEEEDYLKVFRFLTSRPSATAKEISDGTGVDIKLIYRFLRENRLQLVSPDTGLRCERCEAPISAGKICEKCKQEVYKDLKEDLNKIKEKIVTKERYKVFRDKKSGKILRKKIEDS